MINEETSADLSNIEFDNAQIGAVRLHYARAGAGGQLVVLLHGFPESWYSWRHQLNALSDRYTVVAPDLRGYNLSDKPAGVGSYRMDELVDDVTGFIHLFGREKAVVVGHDWGAAIAWEAARRHPETISKVAALQVPPMNVWRGNMTARQLLASWYMFFFQLPAVPEWLLSRDDYRMLADSLRRTTAERGVFTDADIAEYKKAWSESGALTAMINYYRANAFRNLFLPSAEAKSSTKIAVPSLFIYGEKDFAILPETTRDIGSIIDAPFSEVRIPDAGHWVQQEAPEIVNDTLREFLSEENV